jgi:hypothetical protein
MAPVDGWDLIGYRALIGQRTRTCQRQGAKQKPTGG